MKGHDFDSLKPGDTVVVVSGYGRKERLGKVERLTKTQIVVKNCAYKFKRRNGYAVGTFTFDRWHIYIPTDEEAKTLRKSIEHKKKLDMLKEQVEKLKPEDVDIITLDELLARLP